MCCWLKEIRTLALTVKIKMPFPLINVIYLIIKALLYIVLFIFWFIHVLIGIDKNIFLYKNIMYYFLFARVFKIRKDFMDIREFRLHMLFGKTFLWSADMNHVLIHHDLSTVHTALARSLRVKKTLNIIRTIFNNFEGFQFTIEGHPKTTVLKNVDPSIKLFK